MDRATQRFTLHTRLVTIALSIVFVLGAHFDALRVFKQLSADPELRAKVVASAEATQKRAETIVTPATAAPSPAAGQSASPAASARGQDVGREAGVGALTIVRRWS